MPPPPSWSPACVSPGRRSSPHGSDPQGSRLWVDEDTAEAALLHAVAVEPLLMRGIGGHRHRAGPCPGGPRPRTRGRHPPRRAVIRRGSAADERFPLATDPARGGFWPHDRSRPARRGPGHPPAPPDHQHAQADAAGGRGPVHRAPDRPCPRGRRDPDHPGHLVQGRGVPRLLRGRREVRGRADLRRRGPPDGDRWRDPARRRAPALRAQRPGHGLQRRRPGRGGPAAPLRRARRDEGRRHALPDPGRRSEGVRPRADRRPTAG